MMRSLLFAGATRPDLVAKLPRSRPDAAVVDLEDAVPASHKPQAREPARRLAISLAREHPDVAVYVRVNGPGTPWHTQDLEFAVGPELAGVVVPKVERPDQLAGVRAALNRLGLDGLRIVAGIESARGVWNAHALASAELSAVYFGAEDYVADLGGRRTADGQEVLYARSHVALAARLTGIAAIDQAVIDFRDADRFRTDAHKGRALGYAGKLCIHPSQVPLAHEAFGASPDEVARARLLLEAWERAAAEGVGAVEFDGAMIDGPALRLARRTLERG